MNRFRRKGVYTYWTILWLLMFMSLGAILINIHMTHEIHKRVIMATDEAARERARAIDTILKEQEGVVELFHQSGTYDDNIEDYALSKDEVYTKKVTGHSEPKRPGSSLYTNSLTKADDVAKFTVVDYLNTVFDTNINGDSVFVSFTENNVCVDIQPLPSDSDWDKDLPRTFSCSTNLGTVKVEGIKLSTVEENTITVFDPNGIPNDSDDQKLHVLNVAFVGVRYEHHYFLSTFIEKMGANPIGSKGTWALAYPQVDRCYEGAINCTS